jgi:F-type H+-transporting ATPase subunit a
VEALEIKTIFTLKLFGHALPITETVVVSWAVMLILIVAALLLTRSLKEVPSGPQAILETAVEFLNNFAKDQFGKWGKHLGPYLGTLFLFLLTANVIAVISPVEIKAFGREFIPPFVIKPPTRDINVAGALALISMLLVLVLGFAARGPGGWCKQLFHPAPIMLPFNLMDYGTRLLSLSLRLFGNMLGGFVLMHMIEGLFPVGIPMICSLYFDFFDGLLQAGIFVFLTSLYISEAVTVHRAE